jgi:hypothetical protein
VDGRYVLITPQPGLLYVAEELAAVVHLCACGILIIYTVPISIGSIYLTWLLNKITRGPYGFPLGPTV